MVRHAVLGSRGGHRGVASAWSSAPPSSMRSNAARLITMRRPRVSAGISPRRTHSYAVVLLMPNSATALVTVYVKRSVRMSSISCDAVARCPKGATERRARQATSRTPLNNGLNSAHGRVYSGLNTRRRGMREPLGRGRRAARRLAVQAPTTAEHGQVGTGEGNVAHGRGLSAGRRENSHHGRTRPSHLARATAPSFAKGRTICLNEHLASGTFAARTEGTSSIAGLNNNPFKNAVGAFINRDFAAGSAELKFDC